MLAVFVYYVFSIISAYAIQVMVIQISAYIIAIVLHEVAISLYTACKIIEIISHSIHAFFAIILYISSSIVLVALFAIYAAIIEAAIHDVIIIIFDASTII
jgi:hypothetical protein